MHISKMIVNDEEFVRVPFQVDFNSSDSFSLKRRLENQKRIAEFGPQREALFAVPDEAPGCYFKRFSNDGRFIFAFGGESRFLVYPVSYKGKIEEEVPVGFSDFFRTEPIEIDVISGLREIEACPELASSLLCRDFCLSVKDPQSNLDNFVILAGSSPADCYEIEDKPPKSYMIRSGNVKRSILNDSHTAFPCLDHVTFFLVSLKTMKVVDFIHFKYEFIYLAHHLGVGMRENLFSILSMKNQRIFVFEIDFEKGKFIEFDEIARNSQTDKEAESCEIGKIAEGAQRDDSWGRLGISGLIMKMIKHLVDKNGLRSVPLPSSILSTLHIWKHQILSEDKILLRLVHANMIISTNPRHQSMVHALDPLPSIHKNSYLIIYDRKRKEVEFVGNSADVRLFDFLRDNWCWFRGRSGDFEGFERIWLTVKRSYSIADEEEHLPNSAIRRFTNLLPQSPQQQTDSVLFDPKIFRWDPKITPILSRQTPISCNYFLNMETIAGATGLNESNYGPERIKFFSRAKSQLVSHSLRFVDEETLAQSSVQADASANGMDKHKWINVMFHPTLPMVVVYQYGIFRALNLRIFYN